MRALRLTMVFLVASVSAIPAMAQGPDSFFDVFWAELGGGPLGGGPTIWNQLISGGGSGYHTPVEGPWFYYEAPPGTIQTDPWGNVNTVPGWHNEWFYDGNLRMDRYKVVDVNFTYGLLDPAMPGGADIVINWSTPGWVDPDPLNPSPPMSNDFIGRATVGGAWLEAGDLQPRDFSGHFDLRQFGVPYNPEWVSIDIVGYNVRLSDPGMPGSFRHECIPEPGTLVLLVTCLLALLTYARRRR